MKKFIFVPSHTEHYQWDEIEEEDMAEKCCKRGLCEKLT